MVLWAHVSQRPNGTSIGSAFVHGMSVSSTHRQTDTQTMLRVTSVAVGGIYAMHVMQPKMS